MLFLGTVLSLLSVNFGAQQLSCSDVDVDTGELTIPNLVTRINDHAFENCAALVKVNVNHQSGMLHTIGKAAFKNCVNLEQIQIPNSVVHVANDAFHGCPKLDLVVPAAKFSVFTFLYDIGFIEKFPSQYREQGLSYMNGGSRSL